MVLYKDDSKIDDKVGTLSIMRCRGMHVCQDKRMLEDNSSVYQAGFWSIRKALTRTQTRMRWWTYV